MLCKDSQGSLPLTSGCIIQELQASRGYIRHTTSVSCTDTILLLPLCCRWTNLCELLTHIAQTKYVRYTSIEASQDMEKQRLAESLINKSSSSTSPAHQQVQLISIDLERLASIPTSSGRDQQAGLLQRQRHPKRIMLNVTSRCTAMLLYLVVEQAAVDC